MSQFVTIVNRSSKPLKGMWDGRSHTIPPGRSQFTRVQAEAFKRQNPVMGTQNQFNLSMQYLIGIEEDHDPVTPMEQSDSIELWSPGQHKRPVEVVPGDNGIFSARDVASPQSRASTFVKP